MHLFARIDRLLRRSAISATRLGREAIGDPRFVQQLRRGRSPRPETVARVEAWLDGAEAAAERSPCRK